MHHSTGVKPAQQEPYTKKLTACIQFFGSFFSPSEEETSMSCRNIAEGIEHGNSYFA